jgi:hypothetical protein
LIRTVFTVNQASIKDLENMCLTQTPTQWVGTGVSHRGVKLLVSVDDLSHVFTAEIKVCGTITSTNPDIHMAQVLHSTHRLCYQIICWKVEDFGYPEYRGFSETSVTNHQSPMLHNPDNVRVIIKAVQTLYRIYCMFAHVHKHQIWQFFKTFVSRCQDAATEMCCFTVSIVTSTINLEFTHGVLRGFESCDFDKEFI